MPDNLVKNIINEYNWITDRYTTIITAYDSMGEVITKEKYEELTPLIADIDHLLKKIDDRTKGLNEKHGQVCSLLGVNKFNLEEIVPRIPSLLAFELQHVYTEMVDKAKVAKDKEERVQHLLTQNRNLVMEKMKKINQGQKIRQAYETK